MSTVNSATAAMAASQAAQTNAAANALSSGTSSSANLDPTESTFLQLLVAQLKNQDPTQPQDPTAFVSELAQFNEVQQDITIANNTTSIASDLAPSASGTNPATPASGN